MTTQMKLVDHYHFLLDDRDEMRRDVRRIVNSRHDKKNKRMNTEKMLYAINLRLDTYFRKRDLQLKALISTELMVEKVSS